MLHGRLPTQQRAQGSNVLAYNLVALLMCDTAEVSDKHNRQFSFSHARDTFVRFGAERKTINDLEWLIT